MRVQETGLPGLIVLEPKVFRDERGFFVETYNKERAAGVGLFADFVQDNHAMSVSPGVLRGLHFQKPPMAQAKLVRVTKGAVFDVAVDLRQGSPTQGRWYGVTLTADNFLQLFVPRGFAHGYLTLAPNTEFLYKVDNLYSPENDAGLAWDDPELGIDWPDIPGGGAPILSDKDRQLPGFGGFTSPFEFAT